MTIHDLARILRNVRMDGEWDRRMACNIHLFSIHYAEELKGKDLAELVRLAGIPQSFNREISKGIKLSDYVHLSDAAIRILDRADRP